MLSLVYYQAVILTTQLQPQLLYKHTSSYYILLGCKNQLQFRESHPSWAMIELEQTFEGGFDIYFIFSVPQAFDSMSQCQTENSFTQVDCGLLDRQKSVR